MIIETYKLAPKAIFTKVMMFWLVQKLALFAYDVSWANLKQSQFFWASQNIVPLVKVALSDVT